MSSYVNEERDVSPKSNAEQQQQFMLWIIIQKIKVNVQHKINILIIPCYN